MRHAWLVLLLSGCPGASDVKEPVPALAYKPTDCVPCHVEIDAEWRESIHAQSWSDPIFQAEYQGTLQKFCRDCHAPLANDQMSKQLRLTSQNLGVGCVACHIDTPSIVRQDGREQHGPWKAEAVALMSASATCGPCHQFGFPDAKQVEGLRYHPDRPLQNTLAEWTQSESYLAKRPCQDCHMPTRTAPSGETHQSHRFGILSDPRRLASAVKVDISAHRLDENRVSIEATIRGRHIGHAFPTGDMFREALLSVTDDQNNTEVFVLKRYFAKTPNAQGDGHLLGQVDDTRVPPPGGDRKLTIEMELTTAQNSPLQWRLELFRLPMAAARARGISERKVRIPIQDGTVSIQ